MEFSEKDATDVAKVKAIMLAKALEGNVAAALAFASLLNAETERIKEITPAMDVSTAEVTPMAISEIASPKIENPRGRRADLDLSFGEMQRRRAIASKVEADISARR